MNEIDALLEDIKSRLNAMQTTAAEYEAELEQLRTENAILKNNETVLKRRVEQIDAERRAVHPRMITAVADVLSQESMFIGMTRGELMRLAKSIAEAVAAVRRNPGND